MKQEEIENKIKELETQLKNYRGRLEKARAKTHDIILHGGDGTHDNSAYEALIMEIEKINSLIDEVRHEIYELRKLSL